MFSRTVRRTVPVVMNRHLSCPGSLLLAGEYLVTEENGQGIAIAVPPRGHLTSGPGDKASSECLFAGRRYEWTEDVISDDSLPGLVHRRLLPRINPEYRRLKADTSAFYHSDGRKIGYGSSAAGTLLLAAGWYGTEDRHFKQLGQVAVECHREFQGGYGSGYDIFCSLYGGFGMFSGGRRPAWKTLDWPADLSGWIIPGNKAVSSSEAVSRYIEWKTGHPEIHRDYRLEVEKLLAGILPAAEPTVDIPAFSPPAADSLIESRTPPPVTATDLVIGLREMGNLARQLGNMIGVPADPVLPEQLKSLVAGENGLAVKCLGAGNELSLVLACSDALDPDDVKLLENLVRQGDAAELEIDSRGLSEETE